MTYDSDDTTIMPSYMKLPHYFLKSLETVGCACCLPPHRTPHSPPLHRVLVKASGISEPHHTHRFLRVVHCLGATDLRVERRCSESRSTSRGTTLTRASLKRTGRGRDDGSSRSRASRPRTRCVRERDRALLRIRAARGVAFHPQIQSMELGSTPALFLVRAAASMMPSYFTLLALLQR